MIGNFSHITDFGKGPVAEFTGQYHDPTICRMINYRLDKRSLRIRIDNMKRAGKDCAEEEFAMSQIDATADRK